MYRWTAVFAGLVTLAVVTIGMVFIGTDDGGRTVPKPKGFWTTAPTPKTTTIPSIGMELTIPLGWEVISEGNPNDPDRVVVAKVATCKDVQTADMLGGCASVIVIQRVTMDDDTASTVLDGPLQGCGALMPPGHPVIIQGIQFSSMTVTCESPLFGGETITAEVLNAPASRNFMAYTVGGSKQLHEMLETARFG